MFPLPVIVYLNKWKAIIVQMDFKKAFDSVHIEKMMKIPKT